MPFNDLCWGFIFMSMRQFAAASVGLHQGFGVVSNYFSLFPDLLIILE